MGDRCITAGSVAFSVMLFLWGPSAYAGGKGKEEAGNLKPKVECSAMAGRKIPASKIGLPTGGAEITAAVVDQGSIKGVPSADFVPSFCKIDGTIAPVDPAAPPINFRVDIPVDWNGEAIQIGGNGFDGFIPNLAALNRDRPGSPLGPAFPPDAPFPISRGYATYGGDSGHQTGAPPGGAAGAAPAPQQAGRGIQQVANIGQTRGTGAAGTRLPASGGGNANNAWWGSDESLMNFAHEHIKKTHDAAMEIITQMYGMKPRINYFMGESQGGREAVASLAYYPEDYDGVLASVPISTFTGIHYGREYRIKLQLNPDAWVPVEKAEAIGKEVLRQCDDLDGLQDGVINNYYACDRLFDPTITPHPLAKLRCPGGADTGNDCLSDAQIATIDAFHAPIKFGFPLANGEAEFPGMAAGSEYALGWLLLPVTPSSTNIDRYQRAADPMFQTRYSELEKWGVLNHPVKDLQEPIQSISKVMDVSIDWSKFFARGGKLILHSAANDTNAHARGQMVMYEREVKRFGQAAVDQHVRYYVTPNANHGSISFSATTGEPQARYMDLVAPLEDWVEKGIAPPDAIPQTLEETTAPYKVIRSRPLCRYPKYPRYNGTGDPNNMESYTCAAP